MAAILSILFIAPFLKKRGCQIFLVLYAFAVLMAKDLRMTLVEIGLLAEGRGFFQYYSTTYLVMAVGAVILLSGWQRIFSASVFLLFSLYNILIYIFWGHLSIVHYNIVPEVVMLIQIAIASAKEHAFSKESLWIMLSSFLVYHAAARYI